jgi:hypothetical protein
MNTLNRVTIRTILLAALSCAAGAAIAQPPQGQQSPADQPPSDQQQHRHHGPPPEALEACKSATSGQQCSFTSPHGDQISGTCLSREEGKPLACRPSHPPGAGGEQPGAQPPKQ